MGREDETFCYLQNECEEKTSCGLQMGREDYSFHDHKNFTTNGVSTTFQRMWQLSRNYSDTTVTLAVGAKVSF